MDAGMGDFLKIIRSVKPDALDTPQAEETFRSRFDNIKKITDTGKDFVQTSAGKITSGVVLVGFVGTVITVQLNSFKNQINFNNEIDIESGTTMSWLEIMPGKDVEEIIIDPHDPQSVFVWVEETGEKILYRTTDAGKTWELVVDEYLTGGRFCFDPSNPNSILVTRTIDEKGQIYVTRDGGNTWRQTLQYDFPLGDCLYSNQSMVYVEAEPSENHDEKETYYGYLVSNDGGESWSNKKGISLFDDTDINEYYSIESVNPNNPNNLLLYYRCYGTFPNDMSTWVEYGFAMVVGDKQPPQKIEIPENGMDRLSSIQFNPNNPSIVYACYGGDITKISTDGGYSWRNIDLIIVDGKGYHDQAICSKTGEMYFHPSKESIMYMVLIQRPQDDIGDSLVKSVDGGVEWETISPKEGIGDINSFAVSTQNPPLLYLATEEGLYLAYDGQ